MDIKSNNSSKQYRSRKNGILIALTEVLRCSNPQLRNKWCNQSLYKLHIIHNVLENSHCNICLDSLKVDNENSLVIVNVLENVLELRVNNNNKAYAQFMIKRGR